MANLAIMAILLLVFLLTRKREGTARLDGISLGLLCARVGRRLGLLVFAYRPNRVYWKIGLVGRGA